MNRPLLKRVCGFLLLAMLCLGQSRQTLAWTQHGPAGVIIHPRGNFVTFEYYGNGLDLTLSSDWRDFQKSNSGQYVQPGSAIVAAYLAKSVLVSSGGHPLVGHLVFQRQKCPTTPDVSTFRAIVEYRDPTNAPITGPLTIVSYLFSFDKSTIIHFSLGSDAVDARLGIPITFPASQILLTPQHVAADSVATGLWAALDGTTVLLLLLLLSPISEIKPIRVSWLRFAIGVAIGSIVAAAAHLPLNELTGRWLMVAIVLIAALVNFAGSRITRRDIPELGLGILAGAAMAFPLAEFGLPSHLSLLAVLANSVGALIGVVICGAGAAVFVLLAEREAQKRSRIDPKAVANLRSIIAIVSVLAVAYLAFRL